MLTLSPIDSFISIFNPEFLHVLKYLYRANDSKANLYLDNEQSSKLKFLYEALPVTPRVLQMCEVNI